MQVTEVILAAVGNRSWQPRRIQHQHFCIIRKRHCKTQEPTNTDTCLSWVRTGICRCICQHAIQLQQHAFVRMFSEISILKLMRLTELKISRSWTTNEISKKRIWCVGVFVQEMDWAYFSFGASPRWLNPRRQSFICRQLNCASRPTLTPLTVVWKALCQPCLNMAWHPHQ